MTKKILVIDDEELIRWSLQEYLGKNGYSVVSVENGGNALKIFNNDQPDIVLCDMKLPDINGLEILKKIKNFNADVPVIMITAHGDVTTAVESMKNGAADYINKPFEMDEIKLIIEKVIENVDTQKQIKFIRTQQIKEYGFLNIIGKSIAMQEVIKLAEKIAQGNLSVILIYGESGTGKDFIARAIHYSSPRANKPFVEVSCTAIPENLLESELFGYEKGAFTDAKQQKKGIVEAAEGGTLFLNEIGDMPMGLQSKILRLIENKKFRRLGATNDIDADIRVIAATNKDLKEEIKKGTFREDLYYRLNLLPIKLPSLRERKDDILLLVEFFLKQYSEEIRKNMKISKNVEDIFLNYNWPGNIRELKNVIERAVILCDGSEITEDYLPIELKSEQMKQDVHFNLVSENLTLEEMEKKLISDALNKTGYNQVRAAKILGISRDSLRYRAIKHGIL